MYTRISIVILATLGLVMSPSLYGADEPITVALVPDGLTQAERVPLQEYLTRSMGHPVRLVVPNRYAETVARLEDGSVDFACLGALMYVRSHAKDEVIPLVQRTGDLQFHTVFITGANSSIHSLKDLRGKKFAFGDVNSASGHMIPYRELKEAGLNAETDLKSQYSGSHDVTVALVESGAVDAGALDESVFQTMLDSGKISRDKMRIFHTSKPFVDYVFVCRRGVPEALREKFIRALVDLPNHQDTAVLRILRAKQFVPANDHEYDGIRRLARELNLF